LLFQAAYLGINLEEGVAHVVAEADRVEDERTTGSGPKKGLVGEAGGLEVGLGALGDAARAARVALHGGRVEYVAGQDQGRVGGERVEHRGVRVRQQDHVGLVDAAPAGDGRAVEHLAILEQAGLDDAHREGDVVLDATDVGETQIDELDLVVLDQLLDMGKRHAGSSGRGKGRQAVASRVPMRRPSQIHENKRVKDEILSPFPGPIPSQVRRVYAFALSWCGRSGGRLAYAPAFAQTKPAARE